MSDLVSRQMAIDAIGKCTDIYVNNLPTMIDKAEAYKALNELPSAQPERDIPLKPIETTDHAWGIPSKQAVCPKCDYYLGHVAFLDCYKGKKITYCETCGQAIDWEGWNFDE